VDLYKLLVDIKSRPGSSLEDTRQLIDG